MTRPYVQIKSPNDLPRLRGHLKIILPKLQFLPGLVGLTLNGGLSRGYADHLSEIDLTFYLASDIYRRWQGGQAALTLGITRIDGLLYDLHAVDYEAELVRPWQQVECWDASYAEILYDPEGAVARLYELKLAQPPRPEEAEAPLFRCWWYFRLAGDIWLHRGDPLQGHHMCHLALISLVEALFWANREYIPHEKWLIHLSRSLAWTPEAWEDRLKRALSTGTLNPDSLVVRQAVIESLWQEVDDHIKQEICPELPVKLMQRTMYLLLNELASQGAMAVSQWQEKASLDMLNRAPFHELIEFADNQIILDRERLLQSRPEEMYAWHYEILQAVKSEL